MPWYLWFVLSVLTFIVGVFAAPRIRLWIKGAEQEMIALRDRARELETKLRG